MTMKMEVTVTLTPEERQVRQARRAKSESERGKFGTRLLPELQHMLRQDALGLQQARGRRCTIEELLEVLLIEYRENPALQARIREQILGE